MTTTTLSTTDVDRVLALLAALEVAASDRTPLALALDDVRASALPTADDQALADELHRARVVLEAIRRAAPDVPVPTTGTAPSRVCLADHCGELVTLWWCPTHELERGAV